jgi:hypothetical protein
MNKVEFEQRAAEMRARNLAARTRQQTPPPVAAISVAPAWTPTKRKIRVQESLAGVDFSDFDPALKAVRRVVTMETDRDGLIDLRGTGVQIVVSPELIVRGVVLCNAVLKGATKRGWVIKAGGSPGAHLRVLISGEQLDFIVEEKIEPIPGLLAAPGGRRPRRPTGNLQVTLGSGYNKVSVSDKRGTRIESKLETLFEGGEALAISIRVERDRLAAQQREYEIASRRRWEIESRVRRLNENLEAWEKAERIRRYASALADEASRRGPIEPASDLAKQPPKNYFTFAARWCSSILAEHVSGGLRVG